MPMVKPPTYKLKENKLASFPACWSIPHRYKRKRHPLLHATPSCYCPLLRLLPVVVLLQSLLKFLCCFISAVRSGSPYPNPTDQHTCSGVNPESRDASERCPHMSLRQTHHARLRRQTSRAQEATKLVHRIAWHQRLQFAWQYCCPIKSPVRHSLAALHHRRPSSN